MVIHAEGRYPWLAHNGVEVRQIEIATEKRRQNNREGRDSSNQGEPARKRARQKEQEYYTGKRDVNRPGDHLAITTAPLSIGSGTRSATICNKRPLTSLRLSNQYSCSA